MTEAESSRLLSEDAFQQMVSNGAHNLSALAVISPQSVASAALAILCGTTSGPVPRCVDGVPLSAFMALPTPARSALLNTVLNAKVLACATASAIGKTVFEHAGVEVHGEKESVRGLSARAAVIACADLLGVGSRRSTRDERNDEARSKCLHVWGLQLEGGEVTDVREFWGALATPS